MYTNINVGVTEHATTGYTRLPPEGRIPLGLSQHACPVFDQLCDFLRTWSPRSYEGYYEAVALFILSVIAAGRVSYDLGKKRLTNLMLLLIGRTGISAKSSVASLAQFVLNEIGLNYLLVSDIITPQKLVNLMSATVPDNFSKLSNSEKEAMLIQMGFAGQKGYFHDEFGITLQEMVRSENVNSFYRGLLRRMDDNDEKFSLAGITRGVDEIDHPYLAMLGCLTIADIAPLCKQGSQLWNDGFLARFGIIVSDDVLKKGVRFPRGSRALPANIQTELLKWHLRLGIPMCSIGTQLTRLPPAGHHLESAREVEDAYYSYGDALMEIMKTQENVDLDGSYMRFPEKAFRIAALFASFSGSDSIEMCHWAKAQEIVERWRDNLHNFYFQIRAKHPPQKPSEKERVYRTIILKGSPTRREIEQHTGLPSYEVQEVLDELVDSGEIHEVAKGNTIGYEMYTRHGRNQ